jgi:transcription elongation factor Elf1
VSANFNFIEEAKIFEDTQTAEKLSFIPKITGLSRVISTVIKQKASDKVINAKNVSNVVFMNVSQVLKQNSIYSSLVDKLDENELLFVEQSSYIDSFEVDRVSDLDNGEVRETIISTSFKPGSAKSSINTKNIAGSELTSDNNYTTYVYFEDVNQGTFSEALSKYRMVSFVDEVAPIFRKSDFHYEVRFNMEDGLRKFINDKIEQVGAALATFKNLYSKLSNPRAYDKDGNFNDFAKTIDDFDLPDLIGTMVSALDFFFNLEGIVTPENLYRSLYFATNTETGNFYEMQKVYNNYEKLYTLLGDSFGVATKEIGASSNVAESSGKEVKQISVETRSFTISLNFEDTIGVSFHNYTDPLYTPDTADNKTPIFMPIIPRAALESPTVRIDTDLSSPLQNNTFLTYYKPHSIFLDRDYNTQKKDLTQIEDNAEYLDYLSILLTDSVRQTRQDKYSGMLDFSTTRAGNRKQNFLGTKELKFYRYISILDSLAANGVSINLDFDAASSFSSTSGNRLEVENQEDLSKLMNLDEISTRLPLVFSKFIQGSIANDEALSNFKNTGVTNPFQQIYADYASKGLDTQLPFHYTSIAARGTSGDTVLNPNGSTLNLFDTNHLAYYYYNYSLIGRVKVLTNFDDSMNPIYENLTTAILDDQDRGPGTKYLCKVETYRNDDFLTNLYDNIKTRIIETNFVAIQGEDTAVSQVPLQTVIQQGNVTTPAMPQLPISLQSTREQIVQYNSAGFNIFEKYFSTSIYVEQPEEVKELRFEFDRPELGTPSSAPATPTITTPIETGAAGRLNSGGFGFTFTGGGGY